MLNAMPMPTGPIEGPSKSFKSEGPFPRPNGPSDKTGDSFASTLETVRGTDRVDTEALRDPTVQDRPEHEEHTEWDHHAAPQAFSDSAIIDKDNPPAADEKEQPVAGSIAPAMTPSADAAGIAGDASAAAPEIDVVEGSTAVDPAKPGNPLEVSSDAADNAGAVRVGKVVKLPGAAGVNGGADLAQTPASDEPDTARAARSEAGAANRASSAPQVDADAGSKTILNEMARGKGPGQESQTGMGADRETKATASTAMAMSGDRATGQEDAATGDRPLVPAGHQKEHGLKERQSLAHPHDMDSSQEGKASRTERPQEMDRSFLNRDRTVEQPVKALGERMGEGASAVLRDDSGPMDARPTGPDGHLSFATSTTGSKASTAATGASVPAQPAADIFAQDNFHQLVERALFSVRGGQSEARIALKPDQLGHVRMQIVTENQAVTIKIVTESPVARDLIDANAHQLRSELQQQGLNVQSIEVSVSDGDHDPYRGTRQREAFLRRMSTDGALAAEEDPMAADPGQLSATPGRRRATGIDYFA